MWGRGPPVSEKASPHSHVTVQPASPAPRLQLYLSGVWGSCWVMDRKSVTSMVPSSSSSSSSSSSRPKERDRPPGPPGLMLSGFSCRQEVGGMVGSGRHQLSAGEPKRSASTRYLAASNSSFRGPSRPQPWGERGVVRVYTPLSPQPAWNVPSYTVSSSCGSHAFSPVYPPQPLVRTGHRRHKMSSFGR